MKTILVRAPRVGLLAAALALAVAPASSSAQPAGAIGHPLDDGAMPAGTVMVRVIAGDVSKPVGDLEVHVAVGGVDHPARTNAEGRATLPGVAGGATVKITVKGASGDVSSDEFPMPGQGGVRVMLSTTPMQAAPGGGPMAGGGGMPEPRMMSGRGRPDEAVPPGTIIATVTYDDLGDKTPPVGAPIVLVGYSDTTGITSKVVPTDASGRATFSGLDRTGTTGYFLLARLTRDGGFVDRVETVPPLQLTASAGWRVMLSAEKRTSKAPPVDDLAKLEPPADVPAGKIMVSVAGVPGDKQTAELYDAIAGKVIAKAPLVPEPPHAVSLDTSPVTADAKSPSGTLGIQLARKMPQDMVPLPGLAVQVRTAGQPPTVTVPGAPATPAPKPGAPATPAPAVATPAATATPAPAAGPGPVLATGTSAKDGWLALSSLPVGVPLLVEVTIGDSVVRSTPVTLQAGTGAQITLVATWNQRGQYQAIFDAPDGPTATYLTQTTQFGKQFRSAPFQPVPDHGTASSIVVYPRVFLQFALDATAEDEYLAVRGEIAVRNFSWAPYKGGDDGLIVPLPTGFKGQVVAETQEVANDPAGFRILRPLPPFGFSFRGAYSLPIDGDTVDFDQPLPFGLLQGDFAVRMFPGMAVTPPTWLKKESTQDVKEGGVNYFVMHNLTLMQPSDPKPPLRFTITGLPTPPTWKVLAPKIAGLIVILLLGVAAWIAIAAALRAGRARASSAADRKRKVDTLYEQLIEIEQDGGDEVRRAAVMVELEQLLAAGRPRDEA